MEKGTLFVLSGPAGSGKTTLIQRLVKENPNVVQSISVTTRPQRTGEIEGVHYRFVDLQTFEEMKSAGTFLESANVHNHYYGTDRKHVETLLDAGKNIFLVIDVQGAKKITIPHVSIFVLPPNLGVLKERLSLRKTESAKHLATRLANAEAEIAESRHYDHQIINDDLETAYQDLVHIVANYCSLQ